MRASFSTNVRGARPCSGHEMVIAASSARTARSSALRCRAAPRGHAIRRCRPSRKISQSIAPAVALMHLASTGAPCRTPATLLWSASPICRRTIEAQSNRHAGHPVAPVGAVQDSAVGGPARVPSRHRGAPCGGDSHPRGNDPPSRGAQTARGRAVVELLRTGWGIRD